jgi:hypothetical protein
MDTEIDQIFDLLEYIASANGVIKLMSTRRGVALSLEALITNLDRGAKAVELLARERKDIPFSPSDQIILTSVLFPKPVRATIEEIWSQTQAIKVVNPSYGSTSIGNRTKERVEPESPLTLQLTKKDGSRHTAEIADISVEGISISFPKNSNPPGETFELGESVNLQFSLPPREQTPQKKLSISAKVIYINPLDAKGHYRAGLRISPNEDETANLRKYIFYRQTAIYHLLQDEA